MDGDRESEEKEVYRIEVAGTLDEQWSEWFNGMEVSVDRADDGSSVTRLTGGVADQARLRGILAKMWDLNLRVMSVVRLEPDSRQEVSSQ